MFVEKLNKIFITGFITIILAVSVSSAQIADQNPAELQDIDVEEHLGDYIPLDLQFMDDQGKTVVLGNYFNQNKPVILVLAYYECPMLCTLVLNGVTQSVDKLNMKLGKDYQILTVSIDPNENTALAAAKKQTYFITVKQK